MATKNETGKRYGKLFVLRKRPDQDRIPNRAYWVCRCDCGKEKVLLGSKLRFGKAVSCGCDADATEEWRAEARKLHAAGLNKGEISRAVGISHGAVRRFFDMDRGENAITPCGCEVWPDSIFIEPHVYRVPKRLDQGPIVAAALAALDSRRAA